MKNYINKLRENMGKGAIFNLQSIQSSLSKVSVLARVLFKKDLNNKQLWKKPTRFSVNWISRTVS